MKHIHIRFDAKEGLPGGPARHNRGRGPVPDMNKSSKSLTQKDKQTSLIKHGDDALLHGPASMLSQSILLRPSPDRMLPLDAMFCTKVIQTPSPYTHYQKASNSFFVGYAVLNFPESSIKVIQSR